EAEQSLLQCRDIFSRPRSDDQRSFTPTIPRNERCYAERTRSPRALKRSLLSIDLAPIGENGSQKVNEGAFTCRYSASLNLPAFPTAWRWMMHFILSLSRRGWLTYTVRQGDRRTTTVFLRM